MSTTSEPGTTDDCVKREDWDKCIRHGTLRVALGVIFGAIGSTVLVSEVPVMVGTGLGIGWAVRHCKKILGKKAKADPVKEEDPCECCQSDFEALDKNEFISKPPPPTPPAANPPPAQDCSQPYEEDQCTCNEISSGWSPPKPADPPYTNHPAGCSCYH